MTAAPIEYEVDKRTGTPIVDRVMPTSMYHPCNYGYMAGRLYDAWRRYIKTLDAERCVAIGNGRNDELVLTDAALGIAVVQGEGAARPTALAADVWALDIRSGLGLLLRPSRLIATLRP